MLYLYLEAPFAAFRTFSAGSFRPTAPFMTYSAAYGLLLNLAGEEMRRDDGKSPMTLVRNGLPTARIALGEVAPARSHTLYQQLHNYPVGAQGKERAPSTKGSKYNIVPARRAFLSGLKVSLGVEADQDLEGRILSGLEGRGDTRRYGLPFLGDNNFLPSRIEVREAPQPARWLVPVAEADDPLGVTDPMRLTVTIDRADMSRTVARLFRLEGAETAAIPAQAWVGVGYG
jgi:CRISPR-associated protein Cas5t